MVASMIVCWVSRFDWLACAPIVEAADRRECLLGGRSIEDGYQLCADAAGDVGDHWEVAPLVGSCNESQPRGHHSKTKFFQRFSAFKCFPAVLEHHFSAKITAGVECVADPLKIVLSSSR